MVSEAMDAGRDSHDGNVIKGNPLGHMEGGTFSGSADIYDFIGAFLRSSNAHSKTNWQDYASAVYVAREHYKPPPIEDYTEVELVVWLDNRQKTQSMLSSVISQADGMDQRRRISLRPNDDLEIVDRILDKLHPANHLFKALDEFMKRKCERSYDSQSVVKQGITKLELYIKRYGEQREAIAKQIFNP
jgi:hypothetical protein